MPLLLPYFDQIYVINLPFRKDRRDEINVQLHTLGFSLEHKKVTVFSAIRPAEKNGFPTIGARGCFLSHLGVLKDAAAHNYQRILILEDDANPAASFIHLDTEKEQELLCPPWDIIYLGYRTKNHISSDNGLYGTMPCVAPIGLTHAIGVNLSCALTIIPYFEAMLNRPPCHPDGGPMHVDGAYNWFRRAHSKMITRISTQQLFVQRASKTDTQKDSWKDKLPFISLMRKAKNARLQP